LHLQLQSPPTLMPERSPRTPSLPQTLGKRI
jgi:hypothetical protein